MGKSLKNAVTPDEICEKYGCDTLRLYEMYLGPLDQSKVWRTRDIKGVHRFLQRLWRNFVGEDGKLLVSDGPPTDQQRRRVHGVIKKVTDDIDRLSFNTAIAALIELNNQWVGESMIPREVAEPMVLLLAPIAPHVAEELWQRLGHEQSLAYEPWPSYDPNLLIEEVVEYPIQINGKLKSRITVTADADDQTIQDTALADETVQGPDPRQDRPEGNRGQRPHGQYRDFGLASRRPLSASGGPRGPGALAHLQTQSDRFDLSAVNGCGGRRVGLVDRRARVTLNGKLA